MQPTCHAIAHRLLTRLPRWRLALGCLSLGLLLSACAPTTRVVLLPQADSTPSAVIVRSSTTQIVLDVPYQRASGTGADALKGDTVTAEEIQKKYLGLFTAAPPKPAKFILNFLPGGTTLTPESEAALPKILAEVAGRAGADMVVTGHTDTKGAAAANDELSLKRAGVVAQLLIDKGALGGRIESVGRGKRELLVKTDDDVDEPRNRRVEIVVR
jgi:OmpA-OmpF porin, OOP family